jgi:hypothetical protein
MNDESLASFDAAGDHEPASLCALCKHYSRGTADSRTHPGDAPECMHPKRGALLTNTLRRAIIKRCVSFSSNGTAAGNAAAATCRIA